MTSYQDFMLTKRLGIGVELNTNFWGVGCEVGILDDDCWLYIGIQMGPFVCYAALIKCVE